MVNFFIFLANCNTVSLSALNSLPLNSTPMELELATGGGKHLLRLYN